MYLRSTLHPTSTIGVFGQNRRISLYQEVFTLRSETGLAMEKQRSTTSELKKKFNLAVAILLFYESDKKH